MTLLSGFGKLESPAHLIAMSCESEEKEERIVRLLLENDINYKRSNNDIEMLYINAKAREEMAGGMAGGAGKERYERES